MNKFFGHLKTVMTHRAWVRHYCNKAGIVWQGLVHDLSKYSPEEFFESVKYWQGNRSPIDACKEHKGYSKAWFHHRGRNKHHYEYWIDYLDKGGSCMPMPRKYAKEILCDYLGAGRAYNGDNFTYEKELEWLEKKLESGIKMHPATAKFLHTVFSCLVEYSSDEYPFKNLDYYYDYSLTWSQTYYPNLYYETSKNYWKEIV